MGLMSIHLKKRCSQEHSNEIDTIWHLGQGESKWGQHQTAVILFILKIKISDQKSRMRKKNL